MTSVKAGKVASTKGQEKKYQQQSYDWIPLLTKSLSPEASAVSCASVSSFKSAPLSGLWDDFVSIGLKVEVRHRECHPELAEEAYWIASVIRVAGYFVLLRYEGFTDTKNDFWLNVFTSHIHPVGWCASLGKILVPPLLIQSKLPDFKSFLIKRLTGSQTLPANFVETLKDVIRSEFTVGMRLELIDKERIAAVRVGVVDRVIGGRLHIKYETEQGNDVAGFWCHQNSPLIHPVGWAQLIGHELRSTDEYARRSLYKAVNNDFEAEDATWTLFPPVKGLPLLSSNASNIHNNSVSSGSCSQLMQPLSFKEGMKLEAIDPLNLSTICVATITKVLRSNYLMIGIDGVMSPDGADWFCYHSSSNSIFPAGFCKQNDIELTPPRDHAAQFEWSEYLKGTNSIAAPEQLFRREPHHHSFQAGQLLEAVDLMEPRLVCVATITRVVNRLLRVHFNGWDDTFDQWCDCESPELYPIGWSQIVGYPLEPPKEAAVLQSDPANKKKKKVYTGKKRRKGRPANLSNNSESVSMENSHPALVSNDDSATGDSDAMDESSEGPSVEQDRGAADGFPIHPCPLTPVTPLKQNHVSPTSSPRPVSDLSNSSVVVRPSPPEPVVKSAARSSAFSDDPKTWTVSDVTSFLRERFPGTYAETAAVRKIDGAKLLSLTYEDILILTEVDGAPKVGPAVKLQALIDSLKKRKM